MLNPFRRSRARHAGVIISAVAAFAAIPPAAHAQAIDLGTAEPFVVLGGQSVTNTGPSVLHGDLGVAPGTSLIGFGLPAVVNGATHNNDAVAGQAQGDLTTAYNVAAGQAVTSDLTGQDLGGLTLTAGAYRYATSAQLTGQLTLDAQGDPAAQFVFMIGSTLTTASASSVRLINGASPCNVYWQVGSSATLGSTTAFQGNVMALTSITMNNGASVLGRMLARNGSITLDDNVLDAAQCQTPAVTPPPASEPTPTTSPETGGGSSPDAGTPTGPTSPDNPDDSSDKPGSGTQRPSGGDQSRTRKGRSVLTPRGGSKGRCTNGFRARVAGRKIKRVIFTIAGRKIADRRGRRFHVYVRPEAGRRGVLRAHVRFTDATRTKHHTFKYRGCAAAPLAPVFGPAPFTG
jgi:hypothetical protein